MSVAWDWRHVPGHWLDHMRRQPAAQCGQELAFSADGHRRRWADPVGCRSGRHGVFEEHWRQAGQPLDQEELDAVKLRPNGQRAPRHRLFLDRRGGILPLLLEAASGRTRTTCPAGMWPRIAPGRATTWSASGTTAGRTSSIAARQSFLKRIIDAGFDGVYLDRVDVFWEQSKERPTAREDMIQLRHRAGGDRARKLKPGFIVIAQNAEDLLDEQRYRDVIDGLGKEDLLYGQHGTNARNTKPGDPRVARPHPRTCNGTGSRCSRSSTCRRPI